MEIKYLLRGLVFMLILLQACNRHPKDMAVPPVRVSQDPTYGFVVADTITYQVIISNPDPEDKWAAKCLDRLNRKALVDSIFAMVYQDRAVAYNHETNEKLTLKQVKEIEAAKGFSRNNIGMIQFTEAWYLDTQKNTMTKKVLSLVLSYNFYLSGGNELFGHTPVFRVEMN